MELELDLKITHAKENLAHIQISKDSIPPYFSFKETETMFVLIGHLSGTDKFIPILVQITPLLPSSFPRHN